MTRSFAFPYTERGLTDKALSAKLGIPVLPNTTSPQVANPPRLRFSPRRLRLPSQAGFHLEVPPMSMGIALWLIVSWHDGHSLVRNLVGPPTRFLTRLSAVKPGQNQLQ